MAARTSSGEYTPPATTEPLKIGRAWIPRRLMSPERRGVGSGLSSTMGHGAANATTASRIASWSTAVRHGCDRVIAPVLVGARLHASVPKHPLSLHWDGA